MNTYFLEKTSHVKSCSNKMEWGLQGWPYSVLSQDPSLCQQIKKLEIWGINRLDSLFTNLNEQLEQNLG